MSQTLIEFLASSVIYGPNAAGKTNLLKGLQFMQSVVTTSAAATPGAPMAYTPFIFDAKTRGEPSEFEVTFAESDIRYQYGFSIDAMRVHHEWLIEYRTKSPSRLFERTYNRKTGMYEWSFSSSLKGNRSVWRDATRQNALFLSTAIQLNSTQLLHVFWWFQKRLVTIVGNNAFNAGKTLQLLSAPDGKERVLPFLREADFGISDVEVVNEPLGPNSITVTQGAPPLLYQATPTSPLTIAKVTFSHLSKRSTEPIALDIADEFNGTQVLFRNAGAWLNVFSNGEVLLIDEIDTSLHSLLVMFLVSRFHSSATNPQKSQLVFSTHDTSLLSQELFRRDQIWFVEKNSDNASKLYPLSDFSPRKDEVLERWYMRGRYGALPILDHNTL